MSFFLALECSLAKGSLALLEFDKKNLNCLAHQKWLLSFKRKHLQNSHSDKLPLEVQQALKKAGKNLSDLDFLAVGVGPGRWTGVRTAINVIRSFSFCFNIPIYPVNSLRICAEAFLNQSKPVFVAINAFKNQVYFAEFHSKQEIEGKPCLLNFADWCEKMENKQNFLKVKTPVCISDLEDFYPLPKKIKATFSFKKFYPDALHLAQIVYKQKEKRTQKNWSQLQAFYLKSPLE